MSNSKQVLLHQLYSKSDELAAFLREFSSLTECHLVNFITHDLFSNLLPPDLGDLLLQLSDEELAQLPSCQLIDTLITTDRADQFRPLIDFLQKCGRFSIESILKDDPILKDCWSQTDDICQKRKLKLDYCTDEKKSHEVEEMASAVATMADMIGTDLIVDIGSGRGYLGSLLAMYYGMRVLGFDSSDCNTHSATQRLEQVQKEWKTTLRRAGIIVDQSVDQYSNGSNGDASTSHTHGKGVYQPITCAVTVSTDLDQTIDNSSWINGDQSLVLCGLHTCGDLASHTLRMFVECSRARGLLSVGCCYHLVEERFSKNPFRKDDDPPPDFYGFPLSAHFRRHRYAIGRNTRILSSQPVSKMAKNTMLPEKALFWRALLQQLIWNKRGEKIDIFERRVGRVAKRCKNFKEYVPKALKNLGLELEVSAEEIEENEKGYAAYDRKMTAFFQLRCALAQPVECMVLMDRLCYLLEQEHVEKAKIVTLFDPVVSPRCYGLWAIKI